jgi:hypothetical protein
VRAGGPALVEVGDDPRKAEFLELSLGFAMTSRSACEVDRVVDGGQRGGGRGEGGGMAYLAKAS